MDYNDYKYGNKIIGMSASASSFGGKVASGLGASLVGWINGLTGFVANAEVITPAVRYGIYAFSIYIPLAMLICLFFMIRKFDLEAKYTACSIPVSLPAKLLAGISQHIQPKESRRNE